MWESVRRHLPSPFLPAQGCLHRTQEDPRKTDGTRSLKSAQNLVRSPVFWARGPENEPEIQATIFPKKNPYQAFPKFET